MCKFVGQYKVKFSKGLTGNLILTLIINEAVQDISFSKLLYIHVKRKTHGYGNTCFDFGLPPLLIGGWVENWG